MPDSLKQADFITLNISSLSFGGYAVAKLDGKVYFIHDVVPGDKVLAKIIDDKKKFAFAQLVKILDHSNSRVKSKCKYFDLCGGCQWQNLEYSLQSKSKKEFVLDLFKRIAKIDLESRISFYESPQIFNYRNRVLLRGTVKNGKVAVGFFESSSHKQIHIKNCEIAHESINSFISKLTSYYQKNTQTIEKFRLEIQYLPASLSSEKSLLVTLFTVQKNSNLKALGDFIRDCCEVSWFGLQSDQNESPFFLMEKNDSLKYYTKPGVFQQVNTAQNLFLRKLVKDFVNQNDIKSVLDLYCGSGNLSLHLASSKREILGIENNKKSISVANYNVHSNKLSGISYICDHVIHFLKKTANTSKRRDLIIIDPPRKGCKEETAYLLDLKAKFLIYISCNPSTCARDLSILKSSYSVEKVYGFDFFPQTFHVESMLILKRINET